MVFMHIRDIPIDRSGVFRNETTELSFMLLPSPHDGVGVFCTHGIRKGTLLRLFPGPDPRFIANANLEKDRMLAVFCRHYGIEHDAGCYVPHDYGCMEIGWYLNHSSSPNACLAGEGRYVASRDIPAGEEITIDYGAFCLQESPE